MTREYDSGEEGVQCGMCGETYSVSTGPMCPHCGYDHRDGRMKPEDELEAAVEHLQQARELMGRTDPDPGTGMMHSSRPDRDAALARALYLAGGVLRDLEESDDPDDDDGIDPSLVTDGGSHQLFLRFQDGRDLAIVENALEAAAAENGAELNINGGQAADGQMTKADAAIEVARAYTGWPDEEEEVVGER